MNKNVLFGLMLAGAGVTAVAGCGEPPGAISDPPPTGTGGFVGSGGISGVGGQGDGSPECGRDSGLAFMAFGSAAPPQFGATITPAVPPPSVSGGTMRVLHDGHSVAASDPDRDRIYIVDLSTAKVVATVPLKKGDEPGRVVEDAAGRVHVSLRGGGAIVSLDPASWTISSRRAVCGSPRGLAYEAKGDRLHVACADGQLITVPAAGGAAVRTLRFERDLRDVVVDGDSLLVSRFRSAQILTVNAAGQVDRRVTPATFSSFEAHSGQKYSASVAWRMVEMPGGGAAMVHQRGLTEPVGSQPGGYAGFNPCDAIVHTTMTVVKKDGISTFSPAIPGMVLPTDMAVSADGSRVAIIATGNARNAPQAVDEPTLPRVFVTDMANMMDGAVGCRADGKHGPCMGSGIGGRSGISVPPPFTGTGGGTGGSATGGATTMGSPAGIGGDTGGIGASSGVAGAGGMSFAADSAPTAQAGLAPPPLAVCDSFVADAPAVPKVEGEPIAVVFDGAGQVVVQTREPAALFLASGAKVVLSTESRADTGHAVFHSNAGGNMACASCHPEGTDDGRVWNFACEGERRTQSLNIGLAGTAPFHWNGDMKSFGQLMTSVFVGRMSGPLLASEQLDATLTWIDRQPRVVSPAPADDPAVARGRALFNDGTTAACSSCHTGEKFTNNLSVDVGTGGLFQVPSLIGVGARAPFMHNGCAKTLQDRFSVGCGGGDKHGVISRLTAPQIADLVAYMETL